MTEASAQNQDGVADGLLSRIFRLGRPAAAPPPILPDPAPPGGTDIPAAGQAESPQGLDPGIACTLAEQVLQAWLRNRYQLLFPFAVDLRRLAPAQAELVLHAMVAAAEADGTVDDRERARMAGVVDMTHPGNPAALDDAIANPGCLHALLRDVRDVQSAALFYAASLLAIDPRNPVNRHYLRYLVARLQLSDDLARSLEQRFRASA